MLDPASNRAPPLCSMRATSRCWWAVLRRGTRAPLAPVGHRSAAGAGQMQQSVQEAAKPRHPPHIPEPVEETPMTNAAPIILDKPWTVTDDTFEAEVINSDLPVLVDFWAPLVRPVPHGYYDSRQDGQGVHAARSRSPRSTPTRTPACRRPSRFAVSPR